MQRGKRMAMMIANSDLPPMSVKAKKGRSKALSERRNQLLLYRYCFYVKTLKLQFGFVIEKLSEEFFLTPITLPQVIGEHTEYIKTLLNEDLSSHALAKKFPFMNWDIKN